MGVGQEVIMTVGHTMVGDQVDHSMAGPVEDPTVEAQKVDQEDPSMVVTMMEDQAGPTTEGDLVDHLMEGQVVDPTVEDRRIVWWRFRRII